jgi:hypothetical protein
LIVISVLNIERFVNMQGNRGVRWECCVNSQRRAKRFDVFSNSRKMYIATILDL